MWDRVALSTGAPKRTFSIDVAAHGFVSVFLTPPDAAAFPGVAEAPAALAFFAAFFFLPPLNMKLKADFGCDPVGRNVRHSCATNPARR